MSKITTFLIKYKYFRIRAAERQENCKSKIMSLHEAKLILNLTEPDQLNKDYIEDKWKRLFEANKKTGSLYLVSKIYVAKERLDMEFKNNNLLTEKNVNIDTTTNKKISK